MPNPKRENPELIGRGQAAWHQGYIPAHPPVPRKRIRRGAVVPFLTKIAARVNKRMMLMIVLPGLALMLIGAGMLVPGIISQNRRKQVESTLQTIFYQETPPLTSEPLSPSPSPPLAIVSLASAASDSTASPPLRTFATRPPWKVNVTRERFLSLRRINKDVAGWLTIGKIVDLPVMQRDNVYYLTHDFYKHASASGTLFLDENFSFNAPSENLLIHGHNMRDGSMFGRLHKYSSKPFFLNNWLIRFETLYDEAEYTVFAAFSMVNDAADPDYFYYAYNRFDTDDDFTRFINDIKQRSVMTSGLDVLSTDSLLTLSTCVGTDSYFVVIARRIRDAEALSSVEMICNLTDFR